MKLSLPCHAKERKMPFGAGCLVATWGAIEHSATVVICNGCKIANAQPNELEMMEDVENSISNTCKCSPSVQKV